MATTFTGQITYVGPIQKVQTQTGVMSKREIVLETVEEFPQGVVVELWKDKAESFIGQLGQVATAYLKFNVGKNPESGRMWTNIRCWRLDVAF